MPVTLTPGEWALARRLAAAGVEFGYRLVHLPTGRGLTAEDIVSLSAAGHFDLWGAACAVTWPMFPTEPDAVTVNRWRRLYETNEAGKAFSDGLCKAWLDTLPRDHLRRLLPCHPR